MLDYIRDPREIYRQSFAAIRSEADLSSLGKGMDVVAVRLIHACGMPDIVDDLVYSENAAAVGRQALLDGAPIICDVEMVLRGIIGRMLPAGNELICRVATDEARQLGQAIGNTRSAAAMDIIAERFEGSVVAIGNAPTALFRLLELIDDGAPKPALIIGTPVGFVGAVESKAELTANPRGVPFIALCGRRGGSAMAASVVNALASGLETSL